MILKHESQVFFNTDSGNYFFESQFFRQQSITEMLIKPLKKPFPTTKEAEQSEIFSKILFIQQRFKISNLAQNSVESWKN